MFLGIAPYIAAMDWMFVSFRNTYVESLTPNSIVFGGETSGSWLGLKEILRVEPHDVIIIKENLKTKPTKYTIIGICTHVL